MVASPPERARRMEAAMVCSTPVAHETPRDSTQRLKGIRVVVVDDEEGPRTLFREILEVEGATVTAVSSAREALAAIEQDIPDVLVSDIMMPNEDGYWLITAVSALRLAHGRPRALALTGDSRRHSRLRVFSAGYHAHLSKPVGIETLCERVGRLAGRF
jgi:two-component system CheB/CheR fusion protein